MIKKYFDFSKYTTKNYLNLAFVLIGFIFVILTVMLLLPKATRVEIRENKTLAEKPKVVILSKNSKLNSLEELLINNNIPVSNEYDYSEDLSTPVNEVKELVVSKKITATIVEDGNISNIESGAETIGQLLDSLGIEIKETDELEPSADVKLTLETSSIIINHTDTQTLTREEEIPYESIKEADNNLPLGSRLVTQEGNNGLRRVTEEVVYKGGEEINRILLNEELLVASTPEIISIGTSGGTSTTSPTTSVGNGISNTTRTETGAIDLSSDNSYARLVDGEHPLPATYAPDDLVSMGYGNAMLRSAAAEAFNQMKAQVATELGVELLPISCYRSYQIQSGISGSYGTAGAGYSEHQTGLAVDLGIPGYSGIDFSEHFENTETYQWLKNNAQNYGFILSMPENTYWAAFEPWHWRFVGVDLAKDIWTAQMNGSCIQMYDYFLK